MQCQQISSRASTSSVVVAKRNVTVSATKKWQKKAAAAAFTAGFILSSAMSMAGEITDEELMARVKVRVCNEMPTAQICIPKRTETFQFLQKELKAKEAQE